MLSLVFAAMTCVASAASAAPQILALVSTRSPVTMICEAGKCAVELSAFCLQTERAAPAAGTLYRLFDQGVALVVSKANGPSLWLDATAELTITAKRSFTAVEVSIPEATLVASGGEGAAIAVGAGVSLVPVALVGDPAPQSPEEIAIATGPLRDAAARIVDDGPEIDAVRLTGKLINALPERGRVGVHAGDRLWRDLSDQIRNDPRVVARAAAIYRKCRRRAKAGYLYNIRRCFEQQHDDVLRDLNRKFWQAIAGS